MQWVSRLLFDVPLSAANDSKEDIKDDLESFVGAFLLTFEDGDFQSCCCPLLSDTLQPLPPKLMAMPTKATTAWVCCRNPSEQRIPRFQF